HSSRNRRRLSALDRSRQSASRTTEGSWFTLARLPPPHPVTPHAGSTPQRARTQDNRWRGECVTRGAKSRGRRRPGSSAKPAGAGDGQIWGLLTFPWVFHRGSGGQSPASLSIASAISRRGD